MRIIGLDIHRVFAEAVALEDGTYRRLGRVGMTRDHLVAFAATLRPADHVIVEATGKATAVLEILAPKVARVAVANPLQVHLIARARTKTDKIDARVLARLYAAGFLPKVWVPDERTLARRRQVTRRNPLAKSRVRPKAIVQSILHAHLVPRCPHADIFGGRGRTWLRAQVLPEDEPVAIERHLGDHDRQTEAQRQGERDIAGVALDDAEVKRLMTVPGIDMVVAVGVMAAIGRIDRFAAADQLVASLGPNPSVRQSGNPATGRPSRTGHQARPERCPPSSGRSRLAGGAQSGPAAGVLRTGARPARQPRRRCRRGAQAHGPDLAHADEGGRLRLGTAHAHGPKAAQSRTRRRPRPAARTARQRLRLQPAGPPRSGSRPGGTGRERLQAPHAALATAEQTKGRRRRR